MPKQTARQRGQRRLIAGLRVSGLDERLLALVAPFFPEVDSAGDLAYRLWRRGLELALAEVMGLGAALPPEVSEQLIARLVAPRLALCVPLLRRTGTLELLGIDAAHHQPAVSSAVSESVARGAADAIDATASDAISGLGGSDFL
jgi:hypothetical protein